MWITSGTCTVNNGDTVVNFVGTVNTITTQPGDIWTPDNIKLYQVTSVNSDTQISISPPYSGPNLQSSSYSIIANFNNNPNSQALAKIATVVANWQDLIQQISDWVTGTVGGGPQNNGTYPLTNSTGVTYYIPCPAQMNATNDAAGLDNALSTLQNELAANLTTMQGLVSNATAINANVNATYEQIQGLSTGVNTQVANVMQYANAASESATQAALSATQAQAAMQVNLTPVALGTITGAINVDCTSNRVFTGTLGAATVTITPVVSGSTANTFISMLIYLKQTTFASSLGAVSNVTWAGSGYIPGLNSAPGSVIMIEYISVDNGATWIADIVNQTIGT